MAIRASALDRSVDSTWSIDFVSLAPPMRRSEDATHDLVAIEVERVISDKA